LRHIIKAANPRGNPTGGPIVSRPPIPPDNPGPDGSDPISAFTVLVRATNARDFRAATIARKALRQLGWSIAPVKKGVSRECH